MTHSRTPRRSTTRSPTPRPRHRLHRDRLIAAGADVLAALVSALVVVATGIRSITCRTASAGIATCEALAGETRLDRTSSNILIIELIADRDQQAGPAQHL